MLTSATNIRCVVWVLSRGDGSADTLKIAAPDHVAIHFGGLALLNTLLLIVGIEKTIAASSGVHVLDWHA